MKNTNLSEAAERQSASPAGAFAVLRRKQVEAETGLARSTLYQRIAQGLWTKPVKLGPRAVGWPASEVSQINAARIAGKSDAEIEALVQELERNRHAGGEPF